MEGMTQIRHKYDRDGTNMEGMSQMWKDDTHDKAGMAQPWKGWHKYGRDGIYIEGMRKLRQG